MRAAIARRMVQSKQSAPHFYVSRDLEMDAALDSLAALNADRADDERVSVTALVVKAVALTLQANPAFNAVWSGDTLERVDAVNIGVAIDLGEGGLIAPALLGCQSRTTAAIGLALRDLVTRSRAGKMRAAEISEGTFTLTNLGMLGVTSFTAIITPPQVSTLATGATEARPVVRDGQVVVRRMMSATLSSDHRAVDGAGAARFLADLQTRFSAPHEWLSAEPTPTAATVGTVGAAGTPAGPAAGLPSTAREPLPCAPVPPVSISVRRCRWMCWATRGARWLRGSSPTRCWSPPSCCSRSPPRWPSWPPTWSG
jgi:pyruvate dehydrogenase E2 component (dihydrolipoamide acetyltransferase)